jgi:predicted nucleic acid-binding protein
MVIENTLIDTDIAIDYLRGFSEVKEHIESLWRAGRAYLSVLSAYELFAGMRPKEQKATEAFIEACSVEDLTIELAEQLLSGFQEY